MNYKKIAFYLSCIFAVLVFIYGTSLQALPFVIAVALTYLNSYGKKDLVVWVVVLSALMLILNLTPPPSWPDAVGWFVIGATSLVKE